ncbi:sugar ABC transporter substrate-binding protein [Paenibacillus sp. J5C_2022]|uniref:sugar ABC transporter substrate-binding protein n=1 Tax=Paenibacillus sp. J5C2022 TaxID=2977129 RepID=UPI0021D379CA|nr:sugar ABC transporter substrate-binding protein [Paenibacillus sp. J5C2022]MCU6712265.1 sugar ABC transporter substrate-binding protein [Paenibacillus sp. J5C2022]
MVNKKWYGTLVLLLVIAIAATGCGGNGGGKGESKANAKLPAALQEKGDINIKVIRRIGGDDHTAQFLAGAKQEGEALGFKVDTFSANNDTAKFLDAIDQAANSDVDAVVLSHGNDEATVEAVRKLRDKGIEVVAFDSTGDLSQVEGVTLTSQKDESLAQFALDELVKEHGEEAKIVYLWVDGFPPMVRRNKVYSDTLEKYPGIKEVDRFGVASENTSVETQNAVAAMLAKHPKGEINAIFATWDAFAIGAARALIEAGRTEIKIYGIDVSNADLQIMQQADSPWVATAAVDAKLIGAVNLRLAAKKLAGEETPDTYDLDAALITQAQLKESKEEVNVSTLADVVPGWGASNAFEEDWMKAVKEAK